MKTMLVAAVALLAGLFLGGLGPRAELRRTQKELADARETARTGPATSLPLALGLGALARARERAAQPVPRFVVKDGGAPGTHQEGAQHHGSAEGEAGTLAAAKAAMDVRATQFRVAFAEEARLGPEREAALDKIIDGMNQELAHAAGEIVQSLRDRAQGQKLRPREMADIGARMLEIYRHADDSLGASLDPAGKAARDRTEFDLLTQVDLGAFASLAEALERVGVTELGRR